MKMSGDLLYCILKRIEGKDDDAPVVIEVEEYDPHLVRYHVKLCIEAGWVHGQVEGHNVLAENLTLAGHIALAKFRKGVTVAAVLGL